MKTLVDIYLGWHLLLALAFAITQNLTPLARLKLKHKAPVWPLFAWFDCWVGVFWSRHDGRVYLLLAPCLGLVVDFGKRKREAALGRELCRMVELSRWAEGLSGANFREAFVDSELSDFAIGSKENALASEAVDRLAALDEATPGVALIMAERRRQIDAEDYDSAHDDAHKGGEIARAAACYALPPELRALRTPNPGESGEWPPRAWPWEAKFWKPGKRERELAKAGALVAAELDRLRRARIRARVHAMPLGQRSDV